MKYKNKLYEGGSDFSEHLIVLRQLYVGDDGGIGGVHELDDVGVAGSHRRRYAGGGHELGEEAPPAHVVQALAQLLRLEHHCEKIRVY